MSRAAKPFYFFDVRPKSSPTLPACFRLELSVDRDTNFLPPFLLAIGSLSSLHVHHNELSRGRSSLGMNWPRQRASKVEFFFPDNCRRNRAQSLDVWLAPGSCPASALGVWLARIWRVADCTKSSTLMRLRADAKHCSACTSAGTTTAPSSPGNSSLGFSISTVLTA
jgi:hypothetical protein